MAVSDITRNGSADALAYRTRYREASKTTEGTDGKKTKSLFIVTSGDIGDFQIKNNKNGPGIIIEPAGVFCEQIGAPEDWFCIFYKQNAENVMAHFGATEDLSLQCGNQVKDYDPATPVYFLVKRYPHAKIRPAKFLVAIMQNNRQIGELHLV